MLFGAMNENFQEIITRVETLITDFWGLTVGLLAAVVVIWCIYVGVKLIVAHRNEERIDSKKMIKNLIIGIVVMFILAVGVPLLIEGLSTWAGILV
jgi:hypothetical protein